MGPHRGIILPCLLVPSWGNVMGLARDTLLGQEKCAQCQLMLPARPGGGKGKQDQGYCDRPGINRQKWLNRQPPRRDQ